MKTFDLPDRGVRNYVSRALNIEGHDIAPLALGFLLFFFLFTAYFMLRPVRETMGITGGVKNLQWMFTGTFIATLALMPLFGWLSARVPRRDICNWTLAFFVANLVAFACAFSFNEKSIWVARTFYIWLSVFSLLSVSVAWSNLADLFPIDTAKRLFALMSTGASVGGVVGPLLGISLVGRFGHGGLLALSALLLTAAIGASRRLQRWRDRNPSVDASDVARHHPLGGSPFAGGTLVARSGFLIGSAAFVFFLAATTTFLYVEQARLVEAAFPDRIDQTRVFGWIDMIVQTLAIVAQIFVTGRIAQRLGVGVLLVAVPLVVAGGFVFLAAWPTFATLAIVMIARRAGEYALVKPGREMLFTFLPAEEKYKAKNFIDTVVYRGSDAVNSWLSSLLNALLQSHAYVALIGGAIALLWAATGAWLSRVHAGAESGHTNGTPAGPSKILSIAGAS